MSEAKTADPKTQALARKMGGAAMWQQPPDLEAAIRLADYLTTNCRNAIPKAYQNNAGDALVAMGFGASLGIPPFLALQKVHVIHGKAGLDATEIRSRILAHPDCDYFIIEEATLEKAVARLRRRSWPAGEESLVTVTIEQAKHAKWGMRDGRWPPDSSWLKTPDDMLVARATSKAGRRYFAEVLSGVYEVGELADIETVEAEIVPEPVEPPPVAPEPGESRGAAAARALKQQRTAEAPPAPPAEATEPAPPAPPPGLEVFIEGLNKGGLQQFVEQYDLKPPNVLFEMGKDVPIETTRTQVMAWYKLALARGNPDLFADEPGQPAGEPPAWSPPDRAKVTSWLDSIAKYARDADIQPASVVDMVNLRLRKDESFVAACQMAEVEPGLESAPDELWQKVQAAIKAEMSEGVEA